MNQSIGKRIARLRKKQGFTQAMLARMLGVSDKAVSKWERGESLPDVLMISELSFALQTNCEYLINGPSCPPSVHEELCRFQYCIDQLEQGKTEEILPALKSIYENINNEFKSAVQIAMDRLTRRLGQEPEKQLPLCEEVLRIAKEEGEEELPAAAHMSAYREHLNYLIKQKRPCLTSNSFCTNIQRTNSRLYMTAGSATGNRAFAPFLEKNLLYVCFCTPPGEMGFLFLDEDAPQEETPLSVKEILELPRGTKEYFVRIKDCTITTPAGRFEHCILFRRLLRSHFGTRVLEEAFYPGVGLVQCKIYAPCGKSDSRIECFEYLLKDYQVAPSSELFPLCVGNRWDYSLQGCFPYATQRFKREVFAARTTDGKEEYLLIGNDDVLYDLDFCATLSPKELFDLSAKSRHSQAKLLLDLLFRAPIPVFYQDMANSLLCYQEELTQKQIIPFSYLKRNVLSCEGRLQESSVADPNALLMHTGPYIKQYKASPRHTILDVFRHAALLDGKIFCSEWANGYEASFQKALPYKNSSILSDRQLWKRDEDYQQWCLEQRTATDTLVAFDCHVKAELQQNVTLQQHFDEVLAVEWSCFLTEEQARTPEFENRALIQPMPEDLCGRRILYFVRNVGLVAVKEKCCDGDRLVFLEDLHPRSQTGSYFPLRIASTWRYRIDEEDDISTTARYTLLHGQDDQSLSFMKEFFCISKQ